MSKRPGTKNAAKRSGGEAKPRRGALQDEVLARLRQGLMLGAFVPGQVISLRKLASTLGTSAMPVRDALAQLVAANVLEIMPNRSVRVPRLSERRLKELTEVRVAVEGLATKAAFARRDQVLCKRLRHINDRLLKAIERRNIVDCLSVNREFHFALYEASGSEILMPIIEGLWLQSGPTMYYSLLTPGVTWDASAHFQVLEGLEAGDEAMTLRGITKDMRTTLKAILGCPVLKQKDGFFPTPMSEFELEIR